MMVDSSIDGVISTYTTICRICEEEKELYYIGKQETMDDYSLYLYNCPSCKGTFAYSINEVKEE